MASIGKNTSLEKEIFEVSPDNFELVALKIFRFQYENNALYCAYCQALKVTPEKVSKLSQIPFLPISFFKTHDVKTTEFETNTVFESSGTTGSISSKHHIKNPEIYKESFLKTFTSFYGLPSSLCIIGLLPSYLERGNSSLVFMVNELIQLSKNSKSGFYLNNEQLLYKTLQQNEAAGIPTLLIGVTYALLDFADNYTIPLQHTIIMETGGMKGRRKEMLREEVHTRLKERFGNNHIHSEYGMTELLSQAYSKKDGIFNCPPTMKICIRGEDNPLDVKYENISGKSLSGAVNIIDLANIYSCSFIATEDSGKLYEDGSFEITGRLDNSDMRGCSLMVAKPE